MAQFERYLLIEGTQSGLERAGAAGIPLGRPNLLAEDQQAAVRASLRSGVSLSERAREYGISRQTIMRARGAAD